MLRVVALVLLGMAVLSSAAPLGEWLNEHYADHAEGLKPIVKKLARQTITTTEALMELGKDGVAKLHIPKKYRELLKDALVHHLGETTGFDDGKMVPVPKRKHKKSKIVDDCGALSLLEIEAAAEAEAEAGVTLSTPLGGYLVDKYPEDRKKLKPIIKKLEGQMITNFKALAALGGDGIEALTIPKKYRRVLKDALVTHIGRKHRVSDRMVPVPEGFAGLKKKRLRALRAAKAKAKRCTQVRARRARRRAERRARRHQRKHKKARKGKKCSRKTGCIGRLLPVRYYPIPHEQNDVIHHADDLPPHVHWYTPEYHSGK